MIIETEGDLIEMALEGRFDVIAHGCNCMCAMKRGIAIEMAKNFLCDRYPLEGRGYKGDINKLGQIEFGLTGVNRSVPGGMVYPYFKGTLPTGFKKLIVVNCYTQYNFSTEEDPKPLDMMALALCLKKLNHAFKGSHIGLPRIGAGLAGGRWDQILPLIKISLTDCDVTIVSLKQ
jgi:O-acetyl-ADP-ribose deacetylase (regulator of RNase III)